MDKLWTYRAMWNKPGTKRHRLTRGRCVEEGRLMVAWCWGLNGGDGGVIANSCGSLVGERMSHEIMLVQPCECTHTETELCTSNKWLYTICELYLNKEDNSDGGSRACWRSFQMTHTEAKPLKKLASISIRIWINRHTSSLEWPFCV